MTHDGGIFLADITNSFRGHAEVLVPVLKSLSLVSSHFSVRVSWRRRCALCMASVSFKLETTLARSGIGALFCINI